jgi:hypothetical protein
MMEKQQRLIDANAFCNLGWTMPSGKKVELNFIPVSVIKNAPTIDAVPVVRCKDCLWYDDKGDLPSCINEFNGLLCPHQDDFCSYGKRKEV